AGPSGRGRVLAERWAKGRWRVLRVPVPAGARAAELDGLSCGGPFCMAVGMYEDAGGQVLTLAERWTGTAWHLLTSANPRGPMSGLRDVSCKSRSLCMAVGFTDWTRQRPLAEIWMKGAWHLVKGGRLAGGALTGISCPGQDFCLAVGEVRRKP